MNNRAHTSYLLNLVKKTIDLKGFIEREGPTSLMSHGRDNWMGICPLHGDGDPSLSVTRYDDGVWVFHCFGCQLKGTIIDFCMERFGIQNAYEAAVFAAQKEGLKCDSTLIITAIKEAKVQTDAQHETNLAHFVASEMFRKLMRVMPNNEDVMTWSAKSFFAMNNELDKPKAGPELFNALREQVCHKIGEVCKLR